MKEANVAQEARRLVMGEEEGRGKKRMEEEAEGGKSVAEMKTDSKAKAWRGGEGFHYLGRYLEARGSKGKLLRIRGRWTGMGRRTVPLKCLAGGKQPAASRRSDIEVSGDKMGGSRVPCCFSVYLFICLFIFQLLYFSYSQCTGKDTKEKVLAVSHHHHQPRTAYAQGGHNSLTGQGCVDARIWSNQEAERVLGLDWLGLARD